MSERLLELSEFLVIRTRIWIGRNISSLKDDRLKIFSIWLKIKVFALFGSIHNIFYFKYIRSSHDSDLDNSLDEVRLTKFVYQSWEFRFYVSVS